MAAYYNEIDVDAARWLRGLISRGLIADGDVDTRSIADVTPSDLRGYRQVHFFAGIGGWSLALRMAGAPDDLEVWTGSCPCQPFSAAGKQQGDSDERHLWPEMRRLVAECRPPVVFGEQSASPLGRKWLASVRSDLENLGYGVGASDLCAAGVGAPHLRQRLYWVGDSCSQRCERERLLLRSEEGERGQGDIFETPGTGGVYVEGVGAGYGDVGWDVDRWVLSLGNDGMPVYRPLGPGVVPMAHGLPRRVVRLRGYGNAIVPALAARFIQAWALTLAE